MMNSRPIEQSFAPFTFCSFEVKILGSDFNKNCIEMRKDISLDFHFDKFKKHFQRIMKSKVKLPH